MATAIPWWLVADENQVPIQRSGGAAGATLLAALAGLVILAMALVAFVWLAGHAVRRYMNRTTNDWPPSKSGSRPDDWAQKPLVNPDDSPDDRDR